MKGYTWYLQGRLPDNSPWIVPINKNDFSIGRNDDQDLILSSHSVSRVHARISIHRGDLFVSDAGSKNGTMLNGTKVASKTLLRDHDILKIGNYEFTIMAKNEGHSSPEVIRTILETEKDDSKDFADRYNLSPRERDVLYFLIRGKTVPEIGEKLFISPGTAKLHTLNIYKKTGCHSKHELITLYRGPMEG